MSWLTALILGAVQGTTEFLPVSSSGHLVIVAKLCGWEMPLVFVVITHFGTLLAVVTYYWRDFADMLRSTAYGRSSAGWPADNRHHPRGAGRSCAGTAN